MADTVPLDLRAQTTKIQLLAVGPRPSTSRVGTNAVSTQPNPIRSRHPNEVGATPVVARSPDPSVGSLRTARDPRSGWLSTPGPCGEGLGAGDTGISRAADGLRPTWRRPALAVSGSPRPAGGLGDAAAPPLSGSARHGSLAALAVVTLSGATTVPGRGRRRRSSQMSRAPPLECGVVSYCWRVEHLPSWPPFPPCGGQFMSPARAGV